MITIKTDRLFAYAFGFLAIVINFMGNPESAAISALVGIMYAVLTITES